MTDTRAPAPTSKLRIISLHVVEACRNRGGQTGDASEESSVRTGKNSFQTI